MMPKHALIGGGSGFIGSNLAKILSQNGYNVTVISRMPGPCRITWHELEKNGIPEGVTNVVNLAGQNVLDPSRRWTEGFKQNVWNSRIVSTNALAKAIDATSNVKSFVSMCGVAHYRPIPSKIYTEDDCVDEFDFMSKLAINWEKAAKTSKCRLVIIRSGVVIGRDGGMIKNIILPFKLGLGGPMGSGMQILPWIHVIDLCRLIHFCMENDQCEGAVNAVAPEIMTNAQFSKTLASVLHRPAFMPMPDFVVNLIFGKERSALLLTGPKVKPKKALDYGFKFKYPTAKSACEEVTQKI